MAENDRGTRPPRRRPLSEQRADKEPRTSRGRQQRQRDKETRAEPPGTAQPAREGYTTEPEQPTAEMPSSPGHGSEEEREDIIGEGAGPEGERFDGETPETAEGATGAEGAESGEAGRRERHRATQNNALGMLIELQFENPTSPCRSYSDLERRSRISREALSRYVTTRPDRRRSPTIDSLVAIADAMHLSLESVATAAAAAAKGVIPPPGEMQQRREDLVRIPIAALSEEQFSAVLELLIQIRPLGPGSSGSRRPIPQI